MVDSAEGVLTIFLSIIVIVAVVRLFILVFDLEHHFKSVWSTFITVATRKPKSGIDKEISEEEKEVAELERQKEKMETLAELKRRKERLFKEVNPDCKWCGEDSHVRPSIKIGGITQYYCINCEA